MDQPSSSVASRAAVPRAVSPRPQDAYPPAQIALLVEQVGVKKATLPAVPTLALGVLAGAFIAFGAMFFTLVMTDNPMGLGPGRLLGGLESVANMYLIPVAMPVGADGVTLAGFVRNLIPVTLGNIVGGGVFVALVYWLIYLRDR